MTTSLITGVAGQDGSYLAELLISKGHSVIGVTRRISSGYKYENISEIIKNKIFKLIQGDITYYSFVYDTVKNTGITFQLGHQNRQVEANYKAKQIIEQGLLGKINLVELKNKLVESEKQKILNMYSMSHYDNLRRSISINFFNE